MGTQSTCQHSTCQVQVKLGSGINYCLKNLYKSWFLRLITELDLEVHTVKASQSNEIELINSHDKVLIKEHQKAF